METISINCSLGDIPKKFFTPNTLSFFVVMNPMMFYDLCCTNMVYRITGNFLGGWRLREGMLVYLSRNFSLFYTLELLMFYPLPFDGGLGGCHSSLSKTFFRGSLYPSQARALFKL
nr:hypothetical protein [Bovine gammaherpesvirus 4]